MATTLTGSDVRSAVTSLVRGSEPIPAAQWDRFVTFGRPDRHAVGAVMFAARRRGVVGFASVTAARKAYSGATGTSVGALSQWGTAYGYAYDGVGSDVTPETFGAALTAYGRGREARDAMEAALKALDGKTLTAAKFAALCKRAGAVKASTPAVTTGVGEDDVTVTRGPSTTVNADVATRTAQWITDLRAVVKSAGSDDASRIALTRNDADIVADLIARLVTATGVTPARIA